MLPTLLMILLMLPLSSAQRYNVHYRNRENSNRLYELRYAGKIVIAQQLEDLICNNKSYHKMMSPKTEDTPVTVNVSLHIQSIGSIDESKNEYSLILVLWRWWADPRLAFNRTAAEYVDLPEEFVDCLWRPGVIFDNEISSSKHDVTKSNFMLRIYWNGTVQFSIRISLTLSCNMDLTWFPLDTQTCNMTITSGSYPTTDVVLQWLGTQTVDEGMNIPHFKLTNNDYKNCTKMYNTGRVNETLSCLCAEFTFHRDGWFYYVLQIPTAIVLVTMEIFLICSPKEMTLTSLGMSVTLLLTMSAQCMTTHATIPKVFSVIAIDIGMQLLLAVIVIAVFVCICKTIRWYKKKARNEALARLQHAVTTLQETSSTLQTAAMLKTMETQDLLKRTLQKAATILQHITRYQQVISMLQTFERQVTLGLVKGDQKVTLVQAAKTVLNNTSETLLKQCEQLEIEIPDKLSTSLNTASENLEQIINDKHFPDKFRYIFCKDIRKMSHYQQIKMLEDTAKTQQIEVATRLQQAANYLVQQVRNDVVQQVTNNLERQARHDREERQAESDLHDTRYQNVEILLHHAITALQQAAITLHRAAIESLEQATVDTLKYANIGLKEAIKRLQQQLT